MKNKLLVLLLGLALLAGSSKCRAMSCEEAEKKCKHYACNHEASGDWTGRCLTDKEADEAAKAREKENKEDCKKGKKFREWQDKEEKNPGKNGPPPGPPKALNPSCR